MESDFEMDVRAFLAAEPFNLRGVPREKLDVFCTALTHDSYSNEMLDSDPPRRVESYERLEFLGDAILEFLVCEEVYGKTELREGAMTDYKQDKVANMMLSDRVLAHGIGIDAVMRVGGGHRDRRKGNNLIEPNMRADSFEALIAATYLTYGLDKVREIVSKVVLS